MAIKATGQITLVDLSDSRQLSCYIACNVPKVQIYDPDANTYQPNWTNTNVILTPSLFLNQTGLPLTSSGLTIEWKRKEGTGSETALTTGETVSNGKLTIKQNKLSSVSSGLLTYVCYVTYLDPETDNTINISADLSFSLIKNASAAKTCDITGEQVFKYASGSSAASPAQITLTGTVAGCSITGWKYKKSDGTWADYPTTSDNANITGSTLVVKPSHNIFNNSNVATIKLCTGDNDVYDVFSISKLYDGASGESAVTAILTNDSCTIPCDANGNYAIYTDAATEMIIYVGNAVDTGWTVTAAPSTGITGTVSGMTYTVTKITVDSGYVDLTAVKSGYPSVTKRFTVLRRKEASNSTLYSLSMDTLVVKRDKTGDYIPNTIVANSGYKVQYPADTNFVFNGDFASTDISKWTARGGVSLSFAEVDSKRALKANFMTEGKSSTDDFYTIFTQNLGYNDFVVSFSAKATAAMDLNLRGHKAESTDLIETASLTTSWTDYTFTIKSTGTSNNILVFWASAVGTVYLANVKVTAINNVIHCGYPALYNIYTSADGETFTLRQNITNANIKHTLNLYTLGYLVENETNKAPNPSFSNSNGWDLCGGKASVDSTTKFRGRNSVKIVGAGTSTSERLSVNSAYYPSYTTGKQLTLTVWLMSPDVSKVTNNVEVYIAYRKTDNSANGNDTVRITPNQFANAGNNNWFMVTVTSSSFDTSNTKCAIIVQPNNTEATLYVASPNLFYTETAQNLKAVRVDMLSSMEGSSTVYDSQSIIIVDDGSDGEGGTSIIVGNESQTIPCTVDGKIRDAGEITIPFYGYKGTQRVAASCDSIGDFPSGMSLKTNTPATAQSAGSIVLTLTAGLTLGGKSNGTVDLTFTCNGTSIVKKFAWSKAYTGSTGASAVTFTVYAPNGTVVQNQTGSLTLTSQAYKGSTAITTGATYKWEKLESNSWVSKGTTKEITVQASDIVNIATYRCTMTYETKTYVDVVTLTDKTDTIYPSVISTAGTVFKNSLGSTHLICKLFDPYDEVDKLLTENIGETAPTDPTTGTLWYKTWAPDKIVVLKKWNGTEWVNATEKQEYTYKWYRTDKDGNPYANESIFKTGKVIYVDDEGVNSKTIFTVEVE